MNETGQGRIGFFLSQTLETVYQELTALLGIPWNGNLKKTEGAPETEPSSVNIAGFDVILADGISLEQLRLLDERTEDSFIKPLILACGPVSGETSAYSVKTLPFNLGQEATRLLIEGRAYTEDKAAEPTLDLMLAEIRKILRREVENYLELPPIPWGHSYAMALTHDIDILSLKEMPIARTFLGYFYRSSILNWKRWRAGKVETAEFGRALWEMFRTWAAKLRIGKDVWERALPSLLELEKELGVRSSLYFMPFPGKAGLPSISEPERESAPANRASFYDIAEKRDLLKSLEKGGWEAGVHGIDAWHDAASAQAEHGKVSELIGRRELGVRMHWLYFQSPHSFKALEEGGFLYDTTFGYNETVGFRAGTLQPYHPPGNKMLWEFPLHIQDGALLGEDHLDLNREEAFRQAQPILAWAKRLGGAVSLLWHNQSFTAPRFWGEVYKRLITQGRADGAWIAIPRNILRWFALRRQCRVDLSVEGTCWQLKCVIPDQEVSIPASASIPPLRVRLYVDPRRVRSVSVPYKAGEDYLDFPAQDLITLEVEGEG